MTLQQSRIRWIRPAWLDWDQTKTYSGLPVYVLRGLIANRLLRTRAGGTLIQRASIDEILAESVVSQEPICWQRKPQAGAQYDRTERGEVPKKLEDPTLSAMFAPRARFGAASPRLLAFGGAIRRGRVRGKALLKIGVA